MWRPWRQSYDSERTVKNCLSCAKCDSPISLSPFNFATTTTHNASSIDKVTFFPGNHIIHEQPEINTIKSDCESLSDDELESNAEFDSYRFTKTCDDATITSAPSHPIINHHMESSYLVNSEISSQSIPTLPVASPEVISFINKRGLDLLVDSIESFNCNDVNTEAIVVPRSIVDIETSEVLHPEENDLQHQKQQQKQSQTGTIDCDGLKLLSNLAEQRAMEEKTNSDSSSLSSKNDFTIPNEERSTVILPISPSLITPQVPLPINLKSSKIEPLNRLHLLDNLISPSSNHMKKELDCSEKNIIKSQSTKPISTTSPPPPSTSLSLPSTFSASMSTPPLSPISLSKPPISSSTSSVSPVSSEVEVCPPSESISTELTPITESKQTTASKNSSSTSNVELPLKKRKREVSSSSLNEFNFTRRSERLFVLDSYHLYGINPPDARRELFEKTPPKSKKSGQKKSNKPSSNGVLSTETMTTTAATTAPVVDAISSNTTTATNTITESSLSSTKTPSSQQTTEASSNESSCQPQVLDDNYFENKSIDKPVVKKVYKNKKQLNREKESTCTDRSNTSAFTVESKEWNWSGPGIKKATGKSKSKKVFYQELTRGKEIIRVGDCAVFFSRVKPALPYVGRIDSMWQSSNGSMNVRLKWFYHPEETKSRVHLKDLKRALFESSHYDQNDVRTISHKCLVLPWKEYQSRVKEKNDSINPGLTPQLYYLAGNYDPISKTVQVFPEIPLADA